MSFKQLIVVYGTLKKNYGNNRLLQNPHSKFISTVETEPKYTIFDGGFPVVERDGNTSIKGELWEVTDESVMNRIHSLEGCSGVKGDPRNWYDLDEVETEHGKALMYVMDKNKSGRTQILESGKWR